MANEVSNPYKEYGCENRAEYLKDLAEENGVDIDFVYAIADVLGPNEDFDGLRSEIQDLGDGYF